MKDDDTTPEAAETAPQPADDEPQMLRPCGFPRGYFLKNRSDK